MTEFSKNAKKIASLFKGSEVERKLSAGILRTIVSDIITLYFENRKALGKGILVFNPQDPSNSSYVTAKELENDLSLAQESMNRDFEELFHRVLNVIDKEDENNLAMVALIEDNYVNIHLLDPDEANERIDEASSGLIL
jgi:hypothetical protein|tara:strand:- start:8015 stop:8431 length:417 start_codon:yes stop_codon:yes gene_type:complete